MITQRAVAERLCLSVSRVQQFEYKEFDPRYETLVKFRDALIALIDERLEREAAELAEQLKLVEQDPKNKWLVDAARKRKNYRRGHKLDWVKAVRDGGPSSGGGGSTTITG